MKTQGFYLLRFSILLLLSCPNTSKDEGETKLNVQWSTPIDLINYPMPELLIINNNTLVYAGEEDLVALTTDSGTEIWRGEIDGSKALYNRQIMLYEPDKEWIISQHYEDVIVWNAQDGSKLYQLSESTHGISASRIGYNSLMNDGYLIVGYPTDLYILNWDGSIRDSIIIPIASTSVAYGNDTIYLGQSNTIHGGLTQGRIRAFDASTGDSLWTYQTDNGGFDTRTYVQDGVVYGAAKGNSPNSEVVALDAATGQIIWKYISQEIGEWTNNFLVTQESIFIKGTSYSYALNKQDGSRKWSFGWTNTSSFEIAYLEGYVYISDMYKIYILEEHTGELVHTEPVPSGERYFWHLTAAADKLFAQTDATITAYEPWHLREKN